MTLACEDANSKLVDVVTVADDDPHRSGKCKKSKKYQTDFG